MPTKNMQFAEKLRTARRNADITQAKLADLLNTPQQNIANWERGSVPRAFPTDEYRELMLGLASFIGTSVPDLLTLCYVPGEMPLPDVATEQSVASAERLYAMESALAALMDEVARLKADPAETSAF